MKKVIFFLLICVCFFSVKAQYPISQNIGAPTTLVVAKGGLKADSTFIVPTFTDTSKANLSNYIKVYPGALIRVQDTLYMRNKTATQWLAAGTIGGAIDSLKRSSDSIYAHKYGQWIFQYRDSTGGSVVIPTLQQVTDAGNTSTNQIALTDNFLNTGTTNLNVVDPSTYAYYPFKYNGYYGENGYLLSGDVGSGGNYELYMSSLLSRASLRPNTLAFGNSNDYEYAIKVDQNSRPSVDEITYMPITNGVQDTVATLADVRSNASGGTVTSVATGYGLSGGTITTSGTLTADTSVSGLSGKYLRIIDTTSKWVNNIYRTPGVDSIYYKIGLNVYAIKDSTGIGSLQQVTNIGNITTNEIVSYDTIRATNLTANAELLPNGYVRSFDGADNFARLQPDKISFTYSPSWSYSSYLEPILNQGNHYYRLYNSTTLGTTYDTLATLANVRNSVIDTSNKFVNQIYRTAGIDSIYYKVGSNTYAIKDSTGGTTPHGTASGTDTYAVTISGASYSDGNSYLVRFTNGNTSGATLNINGLGAKTLYRNNDGPLIGGDIVSGAEMLCIYNSTLDGFQTIGVAPNTLIAYVTNVETTTITKGQVVYAFGGTGDRMTVKLANNSGDSTSAQTVGVVLSTSIAANQKGFIIVQGLLDGLSILPTSTFADGDPLYLGSTPGSITKVKPSAPENLVYLGNITTASNGSAGRWYVRVQNGYELNELHDVAISSPINNQVLAYSDTQQLWKNRNIYSIVDTTNTIATKSNLALKLNISDTASMLLPYLRKIDTTNKFVNNITRTVGKDSIIFYIGSTRYAIKDSVGGGGGSAAGSTGYVQFNSAGSFAADSSLFWNNTNKRLGIGTTTPNSEFNVVAGTLTDGVSAMSLSATMPSVITATNNGVLYDITSAGSSAFPQYSFSCYLNAGYTGSATTGVANFICNTAGTGTDVFGSRNNGTFSSASGTTTGTNIGAYGSGSNGNINYGSVGRAIAAKNSATNIGVAGFGLNVGTSPVQVGGYFGLQNTSPTFTSAALMCDNGSQANDIFVARDNGSPIFKVFDGGNTFIGASPTDAGYKLDVNGTARVVTSLQTPQINGNTTSGGTLTLQSTTNATKGKILFGTSAYDEVNNRLGIGTTAPASKLEIIESSNSNVALIKQTSSETNLASVNAVLALQNTSSTANTYSLMAFQNNGVGYARMGSKYIDASNGDFTIQVKGGGSFADAFYIKSNTNIQFPSTNTAAGTTGNQTINKTSGTVNIAAAGTTVTVTNSLVTTSSIVFATIRTNDATAVIKNVVPASGSFTINLNAATTAETSIGFFVIN